MLIRKAAVIGAGTMGAGIACQLANAGVPCLLLDIVPPDLPPEKKDEPRARSKFAIDAVQRGLKKRPLAFMNPADAALVTPGNIEDDLDQIADADWIIEVVPENLEIKRDLFAKIAKHRRPGSIVSSNTSGLSLHLLVEGLGENFRQHFLITHFFNPPRYMYLLELVRGADTLPEVYDTVEKFAEVRLGKGVVECKDTPNFIANRIGVYSMATTCEHMKQAGLNIEEVDAICGPAMGRPKTAAFRLHDLVGNDIAVAVIENVKRLCPDDSSLAGIEVPELLERLVKEGKLGRKSGEGFYKKVGRDILVLDLDTFEYRKAGKVEFESLKAARKGKTVGERIKLLVEGSDVAADFAWKNVSETIVYAARCVPEIADDVLSVDRAIRWGFSWELGPFEIWDALGVREAADRLRGEGREVPELVEKLLASGQESFHGASGEGVASRRIAWNGASLDMDTVPDRSGVILLSDVRRRGEPLKSNPSASLWDIGDGVLCAEFHSKMNSISDETLGLLRDAVDVVEAGDYAGLVVANQANNFSVGANLVGLSVAAKEGRWDDIDGMIRNFHATALKLRYAARPVICGVQGMALGGGCEIPMACDGVQAAAESYMGLVELGVGLIPAGGGTRELACRASESLPGSVQADIFPFVQRAFQSIGEAKVSVSAANAHDLGFLLATDAISMNRDRVIDDAKRRVLLLAEEGYQPPRPRSAVRVVGRPGYSEILVGLHQYREAGYISEYDHYLGSKMAYVLCGGDIDAENTVSEQFLLDLEREVFLGLCGQEKTLERIAHTLKTGKPLRN